MIRHDGSPGPFPAIRAISSGPLEPIESDDNFIEELRRSRPDPGGGSAAAHTALIAAALAEKLALLEARRQREHSPQRLFWIGDNEINLIDEAGCDNKGIYCSEVFPLNPLILAHFLNHLGCDGLARAVRKVEKVGFSLHGILDQTSLQRALHDFSNGQYGKDGEEISLLDELEDHARGLLKGLNRISLLAKAGRQKNIASF